MGEVWTYSVSTMKLTVLVASFFLVLAFAKASPYNKYGRSCSDILCVAGQEECVMEHDSCTSFSEKCGSYPTCKRKPSAKRGCASVKCEAGHFCSIRQETCSRPPCEIKPVCIAFRTTTARSSYQGLNSQWSGRNYNTNYAYKPAQSVYQTSPNQRKSYYERNY